MARLTQREGAIFGFGLGIGIGAGFVVGVLAAKRMFEATAEQRADREIAAMRAHFEQKERQSKPEPEDLASRYTPEEQAAIADVNREIAEETQNVFMPPEGGWDYSVEVPSRNPERPYVIHKDEFMEGREGDEWQESTLTYFEGDDVLVGERDQVINADRDSVVGEENLLKFGHGSGDPNVVYVRNEYMTIDMEIVRSDGKYSEEVHGVIEHGDLSMRRRTKFRRTDDD